VRVGHRQAPIPKPPSEKSGGGLAFVRKKNIRQAGPTHAVDRASVSEGLELDSD
jgi:hypothetical protein